MTTTFFADLIATVTERGRALIDRGRERRMSVADLAQLAEGLLSERGEASGVALAREILDAYAGLDAEARTAFFTMLAGRFGPDEAAVGRAARAFLDGPEGTERDAVLARLLAAAEPRRQELLRRLNLAPGGTAALVAMREDLLDRLPQHPAFAAADRDFDHLFSSWFNRGFLVLRRIDWQTPAVILEKIIRYEAVHAIRDWDDLRRRIDPPDRRCFGFFHPALADEPLIFVEVALATETPDAIAPILASDRKVCAPHDATTAVFYSISNCQRGLRGISFGNFLIKQVAEDLARELPALRRFVTLSPMPGFRRWLDRERKADASRFVAQAERTALSVLEDPRWFEGTGESDARRALAALAADYLARAKTSSGRPVDPVARFHLGNGARLERLDFGADMSAKGLAESYGMMVNYLYELKDVERNHEAFVREGHIAMSAGVRRLLRGEPARALAPVST
jgi:malonyl-CoA decarboxylase